MKTLARTLSAVIAVVVLSAAVMMMNASKKNVRTMAYVSNADSRDIYVMELSEIDGSVNVVQRMTVTGTVMPLSISPDRKYLYASLRSEPNSVSSFSINQDSGKLTPIKTVPLADDMAYLSTDRTGRYLFGASYFGNKFSVNAIGPNGEVDPKPLRVIQTGKNAHCVATDPSNRFLFVSNLGDDAVMQYHFNEANGEVTPNDPPAVKTKKGAGPRHFIFHPNRRFVFGTNEIDGTVNTYRLNVPGTLTLLASNSVLSAGFEGKPWTADIHITPDGRFLYASERTSSTITAFRVDGDDGKLSLVGTYPTETQPRGFNIDPSGKFLLTAGQKSNSVSNYAIDQNTGALRKVSDVNVGKNPNWIAITELPITELPR
ncbi:MAG TPA: beta-propeller fold lactonase family protein [Clostridia bacterium]|nr:beta-propeller fold lactonase family protein [Clostridia bacterium]